ncbi:hypothetical protein Lmor_1040 [Legionella moravica]|uniref:Uncharacterized protein n=1 Tax=Legionella moravica TaxID=39962 RepID=A0A378JZ34_9GAMM|nr:hypothetical protein [Legionella moravica]KTD35593.1 hypothetical protein Lmor_1040 [Legionella moravica]STX62742.1 Uncharacterised protein [Legionella moravica]
MLGIKTIAATEQNIQEQIEHTLQEKSLKALLPQIEKLPFFFKPIRVIKDMLPIWEDRFAKLVDCVGYGRRLEAEKLFKVGPGLLLWRGNLTDLAKKYCICLSAGIACISSTYSQRYPQKVWISK